MVFKEENVAVNGCRIRMRRAGQGPALLYLHGANGVPKIDPFLEGLAKKFELLVPEHPGFGQSDEPQWLDDIHDLAYFYLDLLDQLGLQKVHLIGSSLGGWLSMEMGVRQPARFRSMILIGSAGIRLAEVLPGDFFLWSREQLVANTYFDRAIVEQALAQAVDIDVSLKNRQTVARLAWEPRLHDPALHKWLHRLGMPVKLIWGADDKIMPSPYAHALQRLIPNSDLEVFSACGHLPQIERPAEFVASATRFIEKASAP